MGISGTIKSEHMFSKIKWGDGMKKLKMIIEKGVCCLIPIYQPNVGNATRIITKDGENYIDQRTIRTVLRILCRYYTIHMEACREKYGKILNQEINVPMFIHKGLVLIPMKMRKPLFPKDGAYGYVNLYDIEDIEKRDKMTAVFLKNGCEVLSLHGIKTVKDHINRGRIVGGENEEIEFDEFYNQYNYPATKGDIARLQREILDLREVFKKVIIQNNRRT